MQVLKSPILNRWGLFNFLGVLLLLLVVALALQAGGGVDGVRLAIRTTARTSLVLFLMAFTASSLHQLAPSAFSAWQLRNRRYLGLAFAFSHFVHAIVIFMLYRADVALFWTLTNVMTFFTGGLAYVFIALMAATSFDWAVAWMGARRWKMLHKVGAWYIWISFVFTFGKRIPGNSVYWIPVAILMVAALIRVAVYWRARRSARA
jgi:sulfoxide reductase heme-binding subunit YedZ